MRACVLAVEPLWLVSGSRAVVSGLDLGGFLQQSGLTPSSPMAMADSRYQLAATASATMEPLHPLLLWRCRTRQALARVRVSLVGPSHLHGHHSEGFSRFGVLPLPGAAWLRQKFLPTGP